MAETDFNDLDSIEEALEEVESSIEEGGAVFVEGCTDSEAENYDSNATIDNGTCEYETTVDYDLDLHYGSNLVSFYAVPEDASLENVLSSLGDNVIGIIGEGVAASPNPVLGWVGSLSEFEGGKGYWAKVNEPVSFSFDTDK